MSAGIGCSLGIDVSIDFFVPPERNELRHGVGVWGPPQEKGVGKDRTAGRGQGEGFPQQSAIIHIILQFCRCEFTQIGTMILVFL